MFRSNNLKAKLLGGNRSVGCWLFMGSPDTAEILAQCGFDALLIDHEHSPGGMETAVAQLRAIEATPTTALIRLSDNCAGSVKRALDIGAEGIVAANVESVDALDKLISASLYPPIGTRGAHFTVSRAARFGFDAAAYVANVTKEILVVGMIESAEGVAKISEMAQLEHLDMLFIGPLDLSASVGEMGRYYSPAFLEILTEAERRILEAGFVLGGATMPGHDAATLFGRGYQFATIASDTGILRDGALNIVQNSQKN